MLNTESYVRVIALDFSKAFDTVRHAHLIRKVNELNIPSNISGWMASFLEESSHTNICEDETSGSNNINASVVQGSALGPLPSITASDLRTVHHSNVLLKFADDTYLVIPASNVHTTDEELTNVDNWAKLNNLKLNRNKSKELIFTPSKFKDIGVCLCR